METVLRIGLSNAVIGAVLGDPGGRRLGAFCGVLPPHTCYGCWCSLSCSPRRFGMCLAISDCAGPGVAPT